MSIIELLADSKPRCSSYYLIQYDEVTYRNNSIVRKYLKVLRFFILISRHIFIFSLFNSIEYFWFTYISQYLVLIELYFSVFIFQWLCKWFYLNMCRPFWTVQLRGKSSRWRKWELKVLMKYRDSFYGSCSLSPCQIIFLVHLLKSDKTPLLPIAQSRACAHNPSIE